MAVSVSFIQMYSRAHNIITHQPLSTIPGFPVCVIQITPPAGLIAELDAGETSSSYTGQFAGAAELAFGICDNRRELMDAVYTTFVGEEFTMNYAKKEEEEECDGRFFAKLLCRFREWLRQIRGKS